MAKFSLMIIWVSCQTFTTKAQDWSQASPRGICSQKSGSRTGFVSDYFSFPL